MRHEPQTLDTRLLGPFPSHTASLGEPLVQEVRPSKGYSHTSAEASRVLRFRASKFRLTVLKSKREMLEEIQCTPTGGILYEQTPGRASDDAGSAGGVYPAPQWKHRLRVTRSAIWSGREDSNLRPLRPERSALPGCATPRQNQQNHKVSENCLTSGGRNASHGHRPPLDR